MASIEVLFIGFSTGPVRDAAIVGETSGARYLAGGRFNSISGSASIVSHWNGDDARCYGQSMTGTSVFWLLLAPGATQWHPDGMSPAVARHAQVNVS